MKILHIVEDFSLESGGLRTVIKDLNYWLNKHGFSSHILSAKKEESDDIFTVETKKPWLFSKKWTQQLNELQKVYQFDVIHIHGVWLYPQFIAARYAVKNKTPFLLSIHGMYEPWLWKKGTLKKKTYFNLAVKKIFSKAKFIHAITTDEKKNLENLFKVKNIVQIPNLINSRSKATKEPKFNEKYILYLGRLDEKKGIDILIKAFSKLENSTFKIKIAGKINNYKAELEELINKLNLENKVEFLGMISGSEKENIVKNAFVLVSPSHSEVIGMVNLEAAILKTPVVTTHQTGIDKKWNLNGGFLINPNQKELAEVLEKVFNWSLQERNSNGEKLYNFALQNYSWKNRLIDWVNLYESCIKNE